MKKNNVVNHTIQLLLFVPVDAIGCKFYAGKVIQASALLVSNLNKTRNFNQ